MSPAQVQPDTLAESSQRLVRTVDRLEDAAWREPSALPGWSRAHVVAHLALNAEGLATALAGIVEGEPAPMYASQEARDGDIEELATADPATLRERLMGGTTRLADALAALPADAGGTRVERVPGGLTFPAGAVAGMRLREVEIHHADLAAGYTHRQWDPEFAVLVVESMAKREAWGTPFTARATDLERSWELGDGAGATVSGAVTDLAWWLTGRGGGEGLTSDDGGLPRIEAW